MASELRMQWLKQRVCAALDVDSLLFDQLLTDDSAVELLNSFVDGGLFNAMRRRPVVDMTV